MNKTVCGNGRHPWPESSIPTPRGPICGPCKSERDRRNKQAQRQRQSIVVGGRKTYFLTDNTWMEQADCDGMELNTFFVDQGENATEARAVCSTCPVRLKCLSYALHHNDPHGVWGGTNERDRRIIKKYLRKGMPLAEAVRLIDTENQRTLLEAVKLEQAS